MNPVLDFDRWSGLSSGKLTDVDEKEHSYTGLPHTFHLQI